MSKGISSNSIRAIDKVSVSKICSGQVVLNLSTAVKELIENSLDAGSSYIQIALVEYGSAEIKVTDNGSGVEDSNFRGLVLKHHTSKISNFEDLDTVETFGFRGEALSSLCSLGNMEITTRHKSAPVGTHLVFDHQGSIIESSAVARQVGTTISIANLFVTLPVRHKEFLRNVRKEFGKLCLVIQAYALWNQHCSIFFSNRIGGKPRTILDVKSGQLKERISGIFGSKQLTNLLEINTVHPDEHLRAEFGCEKLDIHQNVTLTGYISSCASYAGRSSADRQFLYINSRPVDNNKVKVPSMETPTSNFIFAKIARIVNDIYHQYNPHQAPFFVINVFASGLLDVNVVPDKRQIMLEHENLVLATIKSTLVNLYKDVASTVPLQTRLTWQGSSTQASSFSVHDLSRFKSLKQDSTVSTSSGRNQLNISVIDKFLVKKNKYEIQDDFQSAKRLKLASSPPVETTVTSTPSYDSFTTVEAPLSPRQIIGERSRLIKSNFSPLHRSKSEPAANKLQDCNVETGRLSEDAFHMTAPIPMSESQESVPMIPESELELDPGLSATDKKMRKVVTTSVSVYTLRKVKMKEIEKASETNKLKFLVKIEPSSNKRAEEELSKEISKDSFHQMQVIGQFNRGFIIAKLDGDLFIIDQHATDEKANFEFLSNKKMEQQRLAVPQQLHLSADKEELFLERAEMVRWNGFDFVINKEAAVSERVALTAVPMLLGATFHRDDLDQLLFLLSHTPDGQRCRITRVRDVLASKACRMSVMVGTVLNKSQMEQLVTRMGELEQPWNCPHGRPTIRHLLSLQLILNS